MEEMLKTDVDRMKEHLKKLSDAATSEDDKLAELDEMEMLVENVDNANALATIQGIPPILALFNDPSDEVKALAVWVLGTCAQNNGRFIAHLLRDEGVDAIVTLLKTSTSATVLSRVVYALSGCVRSSEAAVAKAVATNAFPELVALFAKESSDLNLKRKIAFLFSGVLLEHHAIPSLVDYLLESGLLETLGNGLKLNDPDLVEKVFEVYDAIFTASSAAVAYVKKSSLHATLKEWSQTADLPAEDKASIAKTLAHVGIALK